MVAHLKVVLCLTFQIKLEFEKLVLRREQKQSIQRKTSLRQGKDQQQCQTTCGVALGVRAQATLERGIHPCTTFGPLTV